MRAERALLDTGVLVAFLHRGDRDHEPCVEALRAFEGVLFTTEPVLAESLSLLARARGGPEACLEFFIRGGAILVPSSRESLVRCKAVLQRYASVPADFADATLVALAEETDIFSIFTLDRRGFAAYRGVGRRAFEILP